MEEKQEAGRSGSKERKNINRGRRNRRYRIGGE